MERRREVRRWMDERVSVYYFFIILFSISVSFQLILIHLFVLKMTFTIGKFSLSVVDFSIRCVSHHTTDVTVNNCMTRVDRHTNVTPLHQRACASVSVLPYIHWANWLHWDSIFNHQWLRSVRIYGKKVQREKRATDTSKTKTKSYHNLLYHNAK